MRSLVIGANSLSGKYMTALLKEKGDAYLGTVLSDDNELDESLVYMDLLDRPSITSVLREFKPEAIFNFGSQNSVGLAWEDPQHTVDINVNGAINLFESIRDADIDPAVVLIGAGEEYGRVSFEYIPINEIHPTKPVNIYAATKSCQTMMARIYTKAYGMRLIIARTFNLTGPGQSDNFVMSDLCKQAAMIKDDCDTATIHIGNPNIQRDFIDIRDAIHAYYALSLKGIPGEIYNVGSGQAKEIRQIVQVLQELTEKDLKIQIENKRMRLIDIPRLEADINKIQKDTGWKPDISFTDSIRDMYNYWKEAF